MTDIADQRHARVSPKDAGTEVLEPGARSLDELSESINRRHGAVMELLNDALLSAIRIGEEIHEAHNLFGHREGWQRWCADNLDFSKSTAVNYERLAVYQEFLPAEITQPYKSTADTTIQPSINRAVAYIRTLNLPRLNTNQKIPDPLRTAIHELHADGMTMTQISKELGIGRNGIRGVLNPKWLKRSERYQLEYRQRRRRERAELTEQSQRLAMVNAATPDVRELYSLILKAAQLADRIIDDRTGPNGQQIRLACSNTITFLHQAEYSTVEAMNADYAAGPVERAQRQAAKGTP